MAVGAAGALLSCGPACSMSSGTSSRTARSRSFFGNGKTRSTGPRAILRSRGSRRPEAALNPPVATTIRFVSAVPQFRVPDVRRTAEYYRDVLGFEIGGYWDGKEVHQDAGRPVVFGIVRRDQARLHFQLAEQSETGPRTSGDDEASDVYFHITGVDALAEELRGRGAEILDGPEDLPYGQRELVVRDCNGRILVFGEKTSA